MFFLVKLTNVNLVVISFLQIQNIEHKRYASYVLCMSCSNDGHVRQLLAEPTKRKLFSIFKSDYSGVIFDFRVVKETGILNLTIQKKRSIICINVVSLTLYYDVITTFYFKWDCDHNWVKAILFEFDPRIVTYLRTFSGKNKQLKLLVQQLMNHPTIKLSVHIDIPHFIMIL